MRWLLDQGLPSSAVALLRQAGHEAEHVRDRGLSKALDQEILQLAGELGSVVVTLDADFHSLLALGGLSKPSVVRLREEGLKGSDVAAILLRIAEKASPQLEAGCVASYAAGKLRLKMLPIKSP